MLGRQALNRMQPGYSIFFQLNRGHKSREVESGEEAVDALRKSRLLIIKVQPGHLLHPNQPAPIGVRTCKWVLSEQWAAGTL